MGRKRPFRVLHFWTSGLETPKSGSGRPATTGTGRFERGGSGHPSARSPGSIRAALEEIWRSVSGYRLPCSETETSDGAPHEPTARPGAALRRSPRRDAPDDAALAAVGRLVPTPARRYRVGRRKPRTRVWDLTGVAGYVRESGRPPPGRGAPCGGHPARRRDPREDLGRGPRGGHRVASEENGEIAG
ncbi:hypothetical protein PG993_003991 [Apiospora rasikravindrae]|uniref:Uncharacterized protein n=1 Tax=Apiospora rasikravindrae TaxID=990691 RepID=A0ABR1U136_9PEZI